MVVSDWFWTFLLFLGVDSSDGMVPEWYFSTKPRHDSPTRYQLVCCFLMNFTTTLKGFFYCAVLKINWFYFVYTFYCFVTAVAGIKLIRGTSTVRVLVFSELEIMRNLFTEKSQSHEMVFGSDRSWNCCIIDLHLNPRFDSIDSNFLNCFKCCCAPVFTPRHLFTAPESQTFVNLRHFVKVS